jgi:transposase-like protein
MVSQTKTRALKMREQGMSYSAIKEKLGVSKSTLSYWLRDMPLSRDRINALRAHSPKRIERFRETMQQKRNSRLLEVYKKVAVELGALTGRELFVAGFFLYWGEGGKTKAYAITFSNTDPNMIRFYLSWIRILKIPKSKVKVRLHLYTDMDIKRETAFWINQTKLKEDQFKKPYIKRSLTSSLSYRGFGHGTCNVIVDERDISEYVLQGLKYIASQF